MLNNIDNVKMIIFKLIITLNYKCNHNVALIKFYLILYHLILFNCYF